MERLVEVARVSQVALLVVEPVVVVKVESPSPSGKSGAPGKSGTLGKSGGTPGKDIPLGIVNARHVPAGQPQLGETLVENCRYSRGREEVERCCASGQHGAQVCGSGCCTRLAVVMAVSE